MVRAILPHVNIIGASLNGRGLERLLEMILEHFAYPVEMCFFCRTRRRRIPPVAA